MPKSRNAAPAAAISKLNTLLQQALEDPETRLALEKLGLDPIKNTGAQADQLVQAELHRWEDIVRKLELKLE